MQANIKAFEKELKCPICFEYVDDAVTPPCHHLFCRKCIVHAIERKSTCPVCSMSIQRGHRSLEPQPWTNDVVSQYRLTLQEIFRDRDTDFLFSQVPTGGFAAFKPPVLSPNRTSLIPTVIPEHRSVLPIPPPPVQAKSVGGKKQLGVRCRAPISSVAAAATAVAPSVVAAVPANRNIEHNVNDNATSLGQKREREAEVKQVTFAALERPPAPPPRLSVVAAPASRASIVATKSNSSGSLSHNTAATVSVISEPAVLPLAPKSITAAATVKAPPPPLFTTESSKRTYGRAARQSASALDSSAAILSSHPAFESPAKASADDQSCALNNTPGKDHQSAVLAAAITPNTEPRVSRDRASCAIPLSPHAPSKIDCLTIPSSAAAQRGSSRIFAKGCDVSASLLPPHVALDCSSSTISRCLLALLLARGSATSARPCCEWAVSL
jgi:hypothetical protein